MKSKLVKVIKKRLLQCLGVDDSQSLELEHGWYITHRTETADKEQESYIGSCFETQEDAITYITTRISHLEFDELNMTFYEFTKNGINEYRIIYV